MSLPPNGVSPLRIVPLGGLGEIGLNLLALSYGNATVAIDCGVMFPDKDMHGVDLVIPDLSAPGLYYIIPIVLGLSSLLQQHLMPMQGDPMQQKMMKWMMPAMFTVFMLFLPAGLGIYFLTNTWLGIIQQVAVERYYKAKAGPDSGGPAPEKAEKPADKKTEDKKPKKMSRGAARPKPETA